MIHHPDGENDDDEDDGKGRNVDEQVPAGTRFAPDIEEADRLHEELEDRQKKKKTDIGVAREGEEAGLENDQEGDEGEEERGEKSDQTGGKSSMHIHPRCPMAYTTVKIKIQTTSRKCQK